MPVQGSKNVLLLVEIVRRREESSIVKQICTDLNRGPGELDVRLLDCAREILQNQLAPTTWQLHRLT